MKPEEIDRLFREKLEQLEQVPGVAWNDEAVWGKITMRLKGGWNPLWTWGIISITVFISLYLLFPSLQQENNLVEQSKSILPNKPPVKTDSIIKTPEPKIPPVRKNEIKIKKVIPIETISKIMLDTATIFSQKEDTIKSDLSSSQFLNRYRLIHSPLDRPGFIFDLPRNDIFRLRVHNSFDLSNLVKSIDAERKAGENFYYIYEYNKNSTSPFRENSYPVHMFHHKQIITNFNK
jgi:hypothetical protein